MKTFIARNEDYAQIAFNLFPENLKFHPAYSVPSFTEKETLFSHALAKFQHLVIFEE